MLTGIILAISSSALWITIQIIWLHIRPAENRFKAMLIGYLASLPVLLGALCLPFIIDLHNRLTAEPYGLAILHAFLLQTLIFFFYVECYYHIERAITFRILIEIAQKPEGIPTGSLQQNYSLAEMISTRMNVLKARNFVYEQEGRWRLRIKGRVFARLMHIILGLYRAQSQKDRDN